MATADQVKALIRSHADGDDTRFYAIAMQVAAQAARSGHGKFAMELGELVDQVKARAKAAPEIPRGQNFIEPNPGRRGWKKRHRYTSHGLRFDVKGPTESMEEFRKRLNQKALDEDEEKPHTGGDSSEWYLGETARNRGSIHSDILQGFAADLAERGVVAVYPVSGWWKDQPKRDRSAKGARYALVISIETPGVETDIWTPVATQIGAPAVIET